MMFTFVRATRGALAGLCAGALAAAGCADGRQLPTSPTVSAAVSMASTAAFPRTGDLQYHERVLRVQRSAWSLLHVHASSLDSLPVGTRVVYSSAPGATALDSDVVLETPGPGNNRAFGHCRLEFATGVGLCTFSGGTGKFTHFQARVDVSSLGGPDFGWDGTFSFAPGD